MAPSRTSDVKCITFDLDDTLWECEPVIRRAEEALYAWLQEHYPLIADSYSLEELTQQRRMLLVEREDLRHDMTALRRAWISRLASEFGYSQDLVEPAVRWFRKHRNQVELFDEVESLLKRLGESYTIGAISNGNAELAEIGIDHLFDFIIFSSDTGVAKPDPEIYLTALARANAAPLEVIHVGDDPDYDVRGAAQVGIRTIWVNPKRRPWPGGERPDAIIQTVTELEDLLAER